MARRSDVYGGNFIKANRDGTIDIKELGKALPGVVLTIKGKLDTTKFEDGNSQRVCEFVETEMQLGLNATNWDAIAAFTGSDDDDNWNGVKVELFTIPFKQSDSGHAIRIKRPNIGMPGAQPAQQQPYVPPATTAPVAPPPGAEPLGAPSAQALIQKVQAVGATKPGVTVDTLKAHIAATFPAQVATLAQDPSTWPRAWVPAIKAWIERNEKAAPDDIPF